MLISGNIFDIFYEENKTKLFMPINEVGSHPINNDNYKKLLDETHNRDIKQIIEFIVENFKYVPFNGFINKVAEIAAEIEEIISKQNSSYVFFIPENDISKSNVWVALLIHDCLKHNSSPILGNFLGIISDMKVIENSGDKVFVLLTDDCSYSGRQLDRTKKYIDSFIKKNSNINLLLALPYISSVAKEVLTTDSDNFNVHFLQSTVNISSFGNIMADKGFYPAVSYFKKNESDELPKEQDYLKNFLGFFPFPPPTPVYFDHKIADNVSTLQWFMVMGPVFNENLLDPDNATEPLVIKNYPLIKCKDDVKFSKFSTDLNVDTEKNKDGDKFVCPLTFYKSINYTFNSKDIKNVDDLLNFTLPINKHKFDKYLYK